MRRLLTTLMFAVTISAQAVPTAVEPVLNFALLDQQGRMHELRRLDATVVVLFFTANE